ncbi:MAG: TIGR02221 family CRISPR-associated protein [Candidatus Sigynarchaeota archaeon]
MARILMAFLGTTDYIPCNYVIGNRGTVKGVRFVQEALAATFCKSWDENDKIIIYLTREAEEKNWIDDGHRDRDGKPLRRDGLERCLRNLDLRCRVQPVRDMPPGTTPDELWDIFDKVVASIDTGDEIIADITHGFRALPMLMSHVLAYARSAKQARASGLYYGAIEALGPPKQIEAMPLERRDVPVHDLTVFADLMDWTQAVDSFLDSGNAARLARLARSEAGRIFKAGGESQRAASDAQTFVAMLRGLADDIRSCRGSEITKQFDFDRLTQLLHEARAGTIKPLSPLLGKIEAMLAPFVNGDINNGYAAVRWCIDHGLVQQGYTLLQETMIAGLVAARFGPGEILDRDKRELVAQALNIGCRAIPEHEWKDAARDHPDDVRAILQGLPAGFIEVFDAISQARNDINHGGFSPAAAKPASLESRLRDLLDRAISLARKG